MRNMSVVATVALLVFNIVSQPAEAQNSTYANLLRVKNYELVSKKRIGRTHYEYEYNLYVENNTAQDILNISAKIVWAPENIVVSDSDSSIGTVSAFAQKRSGDTIKIEVDRRGQFNPNSLRIVFDNDNLSGIDADANGVRDDIEVFISNNYSNAPPGVQASLTSIASESAVILALDPNASNLDLLIEAVIQNAGSAYVCLDRFYAESTQSGRVYRELFIATYNTPERLTKFDDFDSLAGGASIEYRDGFVEGRCSAMR